MLTGTITQYNYIVQCGCVHTITLNRKTDVILVLGDFSV